MTSRWLPPILALVLGAGSFWIARGYIDARATAAETALASRYASVAVVVAARPLEAGVVLGPEHLAARQMPSRYIPSAALTPERVELLYGRRTEHAFEAGDVVLEALLQPIRDPLAVMVRPGRRAITVPVDELTSFDGMLDPGNFVDLVYSTRGAAGSEDDIVSTPLLEAVQVIATGRAVRRERRIDSRGETHESGSPYTTVTLDLAPEAAQRVLLAQSTGEVSALLRHPRDGAMGVLRAVSSRELRMGSARPRPRSLPPVEIIIGGARR